ncbi:MAG TPA: BamA/TamA family outer membrane protein [Bacteroidales bacterium]|nr:BamA/TamA family outer membrane protein [Bacteroidales bacterium]
MLKQNRTFIYICSIFFVLTSCNPTKYVPSGQALLDQNVINVNKEDIRKSELTPYVRQQPNKRIFGTRFYLGLYNLSNINKNRWPHGWLRKIGEAPVVFDPSSVTQTTDQLNSFIRLSKGYFDSSVKDSVSTVDRKTKVFYNVELLAPFTIRNVYYDIEDTIIKSYFFFDSVNSLINRGQPFENIVLQNERSRFVKSIRDKGFYGFSGDYINFDIDSTKGERQVDIYYNIRSPFTIDNLSRVTFLPHPVYQIKNIYIYPDYDPGTALKEGEAYVQKLDTVLYKDYYFITSSEVQKIRYDLILQTMYLRPGMYYNLTNTDQTQTHLKSLNTFRLVNINYEETGIPDSSTQKRYLNCKIILTPLTPQSYRVVLEGTHSSGNIGGALNLIYQHKNLFHGAELFGVNVRGAYEGIKQTEKLKSIQEYSAEASLRFPQFLIPFLETEGFIKKYNPSTSITAAYNYQAMPLFTRTLASASFGYTWKVGYQTHIVNPLQLNLVKLPPGSMDPEFAKSIRRTFLEYSYKDVLIVGGGYSFIYDNQPIKNSRDYVFLRMNFESAGNMNSLIDRISGVRNAGDTASVFLGQPYAQFIRADIDLHYNFTFNQVSSIVYRAFAGVGIPYGNSKAIPFEKQYFSGGANSIRAWQVRSLGPGSYDPFGANDSTDFVNQTADIKLELNAEYRFKLFWIFEGALFLDAGNIWTYNRDQSRPGTQFSLKETRSPETGAIISRPFYKDIAVGTGFGLRFDLNLIIARLDLGMKLRDPRINEGWIIGRRPLELRHDFAVVLGIGYPF